MTLRWKLNLVMSALLVTTLAAGVATFYVVRVFADKTHRVSELSERVIAIEDLRASVLRWVVSVAAHDPRSDEAAASEPLAAFAERLSIMLRTAADDMERTRLREAGKTFDRLRGAVSAAPDRDASADSQALLDDLEQRLELLRRQYASESYRRLGESALAGFYAQVAAAAACALIVIPAISLVILTRRSLMEPIRKLVRAANAIGRGELDHHVDLPGRNELSRLARQVNEMAARLQEHQANLLQARELAAIGEICTSVAHGMRNPLAGIRTSAQLLSRRLVDRPDEHQRLVELIAEVDRLEARIAKLLDFSRPRGLARRRVPLGELIDAGRRDVNGALTRNSVHVVAGDEARRCEIHVDPDQFAQVFAELFANAAEHMPDGGRITVHAERNGDATHRTHISVCDEGTGMAHGEEGHAFDLFFTTRPGGTGVGLAAVRRVVAAHGGSIALDSQPGSGTTVSIQLP